MKIVKIIGGLGNQMFQYAFYCALKKHFSQEQIKVDTTLFESYRLHNGLELENVFGIKLDRASKAEINRLSYCFKNFFWQRIYRKIIGSCKSEFIQKNDGEFLPEVFTPEKSIYYEGFWQNEKYFAEFSNLIRKQFHFPDFIDSKNQDCFDKMQKEKNSISIHVRRGDYLKSSIYQGICDETYYRNALYEIRKKIPHPKFYVFSDDIMWCRDFFESHLLQDEQIFFVDWNKGKESFRDMQLMTAATGMIIANSSFSWWAAWLNFRKEKFIIAPKRWLTVAPERDRQLPDWFLL